MFISPAYAQSAAGGNEFLISILPFVAIFAIMYFLLIRPQQKRQKEHRALITNLRRGDIVVTGGGIIGKIAKVVDDNEILVEMAEGVKVRVARSMISEVRSKSEPANDA